MNPQQLKVIYDGNCGFCRSSVAKLKAMDWFGRLTYDPFFEHLSEVKVVEGDKTYGGFDAFRRLCFVVPLLYPLLVFVYLPGAAFIGRRVYAFIADHRYLLHRSKMCKDNQCGVDGKQ